LRLANGSSSAESLSGNTLLIPMTVSSVASYIARPVLSLVHTVDTAVKLRDLMPQRDAVRLARALRQHDPAELPLVGNSFRLRSGTTDLFTFGDVFLQDSMRLFGNADLRPSCIIDCGAHIGCASLFFALKYPGCRIISVEPDEENFKLLSENVKRFENIMSINAAVWDRPACLEIANPGTNPTGLYVTELKDPTDGIRGMTIPEIMEIAAVDHIDILKLDIEGAERRLFSSPDCHAWLSKVSILIVELHDRLLPGCAQALFRALDRYSYEPTGRGHVVIVELNGH
jgi:FkbM family methyltransferase